MNHPIRILFSSVVMFSVALPAFAFVNTNPPLIDPATGFSYATGSGPSQVSSVVKKKTSTHTAKKTTRKKVTKTLKTTKAAKISKATKPAKTTKTTKTHTAKTTKKATTATGTPSH